MPPRVLLFALAGVALGIGGLAQGWYWKNTVGQTVNLDDAAKADVYRKEIDLLKRENESLRSLAQGGGDVSVSPDVIHAVERDLGLRFNSTPVLRRASSADLRDRAEAAIESSFGPGGADDRQEAWRLMGLLGPQSVLVTQLAAATTALAPGWFDETSAEGWIQDRSDSESIPHQAELRRLLARILLHQHFPPSARYPGDEAARVRAALHEGTALGVKERFLAAHALKGFLGMKENEQGELIFRSLAPFIRGIARFPATAGKGFTDALYVRGNTALHAALADPPVTTAALLGGANSAVIVEPAAPGDVLISESVGQLGLGIWLDDAPEAALWRGDRYVLFSTEDGSQLLVWEIEAAGPEAADRLETAARDRITRTVMVEGRRFTVSRISPTRIRVENSPAASPPAQSGEDSGG